MTIRPGTASGIGSGVILPADAPARLRGPCAASATMPPCCDSPPARPWR
ncbi:MAG: hypothetical protein OXU61_08745 [Gammaproteobacteria bacterium]|nr:hypothetical protein [Gammaproteobacteria bacterium]